MGDGRALRFLVLATLLVLLAYCVAAARAVSYGAVSAARTYDEHGR